MSFLVALTCMLILIGMGKKYLPFVVLSQPCQKVMNSVLVLSTTILVLTAVGVTGLLIYQSGAFFKQVPLLDFLSGAVWDPPSTLIKELKELGGFGILPLLSGTLLITFLAMGVGVPLSFSIAVYLAFFATPLKHGTLKSVVEILAGVPSIVYGFFALYLVSPLFHTLFQACGIVITSESALTAGIVLGLMVVPFMASVGDDAFRAVPKALKEQAMALGSTPAEIILRVLVPAALPGLLGAFLMGFSRAIGETMLVVMAAGLTANLTFNPLESVTTITVQIVSLMTGDQEFESAKTLSAFALGLVLFILTLILNALTIMVARWHGKKYGTA